MPWLRTRLTAWALGLTVVLSPPGPSTRTHSDILPLPWAPAFETEHVTLTAYTSSVRETDSTPFITASGTRTRQGVIAISRDLLRQYPYGTKARVLSHGCPLELEHELVVEDTMHRRKRRTVDVWMPTRQQALRWGRCQGVVMFFKEE